MAAADTIYFPSSAIGLSGYCDAAQSVWIYQFQLSNRDGVPLQLSAAVTGNGGGTVPMSPNPVPAGASSIGTIRLPSNFVGEAVTTVNFVNPQFPNATGHTPLHLDTCAPTPQTTLDPHPPPPPTVTVPAATGTPSDSLAAPTTAPTAPSTTPSTTPSSVADSTTVPSDPTSSVEAPSTSDGGSSDTAAIDELTATPIGSSSSSAAPWWWIGAVVLVAVLVATTLLIRRRTGPSVTDQT